MDKDLLLKRYYADNDRYADLVNGLGFDGEQVLRGEDLQELDSQMIGLSGIPFIRRRRERKRHGRGKYRDLIRRAALGVSFVVIGIENQEEIDYSIPLRNLSYDAGEYERQAAVIRREVRKNSEGLNPGEYLYGFRRDSRLSPCVTFILYYGAEEWDGPTDLYDILDFRDIPPRLKDIVPNYKINLVEIRKLKNTSVFHTDVRQVFDFIRCSGDPKALKALVEEDLAYQEMEEDAFDVVAQYTHTEELMKKKEYDKRGKVNMCNAITELIREGRDAGYNAGRDIGYSEGRDAGYNAGRDIGYSEGKDAGYSEGRDAERSANIQFLVRTCLDFQIPQEQIRMRIMNEYGLSESEAGKYIEKAGR